MEQKDDTIQMFVKSCRRFLDDNANGGIIIYQTSTVKDFLTVQKEANRKVERIS